MKRMLPRIHMLFDGGVDQRHQNGKRNRSHHGPESQCSFRALLVQVEADNGH